MDTHNKSILAYLQSGKGLTQAEAYKLFGCWRLGARIYELRRQGVNIKTVNETKDKATYARYFLES